jgi:rsbT co-antagonist protein RsbR
MKQARERRATDEEPDRPTDERREADEEADRPTDERREADEEADRPTDERREADEEPDRPTDERREADEEPDRSPDERAAQPSEETDELLQELVAYLRDNRTDLREEWARRISEANLLRVMSEEEIFSEATEVFDNYVDALETGSIENLQAYARELSERIIPRGVETDEVLGIVLLLRDALARSLFAKYQDDLELLNRILDSYEPAANRIAVTVGVSFVEERERVIHEQQEAMRELSTPVLQIRERLLILPIIGALDSARARQLTEQLLAAIREKRATVVVIDITGVATIDRTVANHLVETVEASRLMGASTILTGLSSEIAQTLVDLGVDLGMMKTVGDLQGGLEEAERLAGYRGGRPSGAAGNAES